MGYIELLPDEILVRILIFLAHPRSLKDFFRFKQSCWRIYYLCEDVHIQEELKNSIVKTSKENTPSLDTELPEWYQLNKPLCTGCGRKMFRIPNFVLSPLVAFVCPDCTQYRRKIEAEPIKQCLLSNIQNTDAVDLKSKQSRVDKVKKKRENILKEEQIIIKRKEQIKKEAEKRGLSPALASMEMDKIKTGSVSQILQNVKKKQQYSETLSLQRKIENEKKRDLSVLKFPKLPTIK